MTGTPPAAHWAGPEPHLREVMAATAATIGLDPGPALVPGTPDLADSLRSAARLDLPTGAGRAVLVLVDGMGAELLEERKGHAPTLRGMLATDRSSGHVTELTTSRPSTTAAALTTLGTGALPGTTGMVGYSVRHPRLAASATAGGAARDLVGTPPSGQLLNLITWADSGLEPRAWQDVPTVIERAVHRPRRDGGQPRAVSVGPARFAGAGLTEAGLRGPRHVGADRLEDRPGLAVRALHGGADLVYLYVGELDHTGHGQGWRSQAWLTWLERLDSALAELLRRAPSGTLVALTADHGMVDTDPAHHLDLTAYPDLVRDVTCVAGEPRLTHLYVTDADETLAQDVAARYRDVLGDRAAWVGTRAQSQEHLGPLSPRARDVVGDVVVAMAGSWVLLDPRVHSEQARAMVGVHGSLTHAETAVPLLRTLT